MRLIRSFSFALNGLRSCFASEANFRIHIVVTCIALVLGFVFQLQASEWLVLFLCFVLVLSAELFNTALEKLCDVVSTEIHPGIKKVKDIAAGAVLITSMGSLLAGILIFLPKLVELIKSI